MPEIVKNVFRLCEQAVNILGLNRGKISALYAALCDAPHTAVYNYRVYTQSIPTLLRRLCTAIFSSISSVEKLVIHAVHTLNKDDNSKEYLILVIYYSQSFNPQGA